MNTKKIVITGGPGTGKSSIINALIKRGYICLEEISRAVTLQAKEQGIDQLFLTNPLLFSELLLKGRMQQYKYVKNLDRDVIFFDRGIPDIVAYMDFIGDNYPQKFIKACEQYTYNDVFILKPWKEIYTMDNERYEDFDQALKIHEHLLSTYKNYNYKLIDVPFDTVERRANFIIQSIIM